MALARGLRWTIHLLTVALLAGMAVVGLSVPSAHAEDGVPTVPDGHLSGTVTAPGAALEGSQVEIDRLGDDGRWGFDRTATISAGGAWSVDLPPGSYRVGFPEVGGYDAEWYDNVWDAEDAATIEVTSGGVRSGIDATLGIDPRRGTLAGDVTGPKGQPLAGVDVTVQQYDADAGGWIPAASAHTDQTGAWSARLLPGTYRIGYSETTGDSWRASYWAGAAVLDEATDVEVVAGGKVGDLDAQLAIEEGFGGTLTGRVVGTDGLPRAGVEVTIYLFEEAYETWNEWQWTSTDANGVWSWSGPPGTYKIAFWSLGYRVQYYDSLWAPADGPDEIPADAQEVVVTDGDTVSGIDATIRPEQLPLITLRTAPRIKGTLLVGRTLTATAGTWEPAATTTYQWLRNGVAISGATASTYRLKKYDAGKRISVRVTARRLDHANATAASAPTGVVKAKPTLSLSFGRIGRRTKISTVVKAAVAVTGKVRIRDGRRLLTTVRLRSGRASYTVRLRKGRHVIRVSYLGSSKVAARSIQRAYTVR